MKPKTFIPLVLGVIVGGAAIKMVVNVVSEAKGSTSDMAHCVVAKVDIQFAEEISPEKIKLVDWPKGSLPQHHFASLEELAGRVSDMFIPMDVPIYKTMLAPEGTPPGIMVRIKPGYRAVAVPIDEVSGVSYQVKPGDRVDVVALVKQRVSGSGTQQSSRIMQQSSRIILQNVEVATVGRQLNTTNKKGETVKSVAHSVTLLLRPEEVTRLHLAQSLGGKLSLALRGMEDQSGGEEDLVQEDFLSGDPDQPSPTPAPPQNNVAQRPHANPAWNVKVISGNRIEDVQYRWKSGRWDTGNASPETGEFDTMTPDNEPPAPSDIHEDSDVQDDFDSAQDREWAEES